MARWLAVRDTVGDEERRKRRRSPRQPRPEGFFTSQAHRRAFTSALTKATAASRSWASLARVMPKQ